MVSVIVPCYQQAEFLTEAVDSVIAQTYRDWEIVIVDDGSTDATAAVAEELIAGHPDRRISLVRQANQGLPGARNSGIAASRGRYILPLDADDILMPEMLAKTVGLLESDPAVAIAYTDYRLFGNDSAYVPTRAWTMDELSFGNPLGNSSLFRRDVWLAVGGYNPNMRGGYEDWDFWIAAAELGASARRIREPLFGYRVKASSMILDALAMDAQLRQRIARNHPGLITRRRTLRNVTRRAFERLSGRANKSLRSLNRAIRRRRQR